MASWRSYILGLLCGLLASALILIGNGRLEGHPITLSEPADPPGVRVSIQGAVASPGVYRLPPGSIGEEALRAAGGTLPAADLSRVNMAALLSDGQELKIPFRTPTPVATASAISSASAASAAPAASPVINLNTASEADLDSLPGIGPVLAKRIVEYREQYGPFQTADDLLRVKGIGASLLDKIRALIEAP
jgi:competence protein ComEA